VLSQLGTKLLGARVGAHVEVSMEAGPPQLWRVAALPYQPERAGHFHL
jgi:hypothetical protein